MVYTFAGYELDEELFELRHDGRKVPVQPKVLALLILLVKERQRVVPKDEIFQKVWPDVTVTDASLARAAMEARKAIGDDAQEKIVTVRGRGLRFAAPAAEQARPSSTPPEPVSVRPFVGREACMSALFARLGDAQKGHGSVVSVHGEAGIGRSRVLDELLRHARERGTLVVSARIDGEPGAPPLWPWREVTRVAERAGRGELAASLSTALDAVERAHDDRGRFAAAEGVANVLASAGPLVVALDDAHLADPSSLALLRSVARRAPSAPLLVVATWRDGSAAGPEREKLLGAVLGEYGALGIPLRGLSRDEVARLVQAETGREPSAQLATRLFDKTSGNPFYVVQLLRAQWVEQALEGGAREIASSMDLQPGFVEAIRRHLDAVSEGCRAVLSTAALMGATFDLAPLAVAARLEAGLVAERIDEATRARLVLRARQGWRFAHPLVRDALYKAMSSADRARLHRDVGEALLAHYGDASDAHAAELAHHFVHAAAAGHAERAVHYCTRAAENAMRRGVPADAVTFYERALGVVSLVQGADARRVRLLVELGRVLAGSSQFAAARAAWADAEAVARALRMDVAVAEISAARASLPS